MSLEKDEPQFELVSGEPVDDPPRESEDEENTQVDDSKGE